MSMWLMMASVVLPASLVSAQTFSSFTTLSPNAGCKTLGLLCGTSASGCLYQENCTTTGFKISSLFYFDSTKVFTWNPPTCVSYGSDGSFFAIKSPDSIYSDTAPTYTWTLNDGNAVAVSIGSISYGGSGTLWAIALNSGKVLYQATSTLGATTAWQEIVSGGVLAASVGADGTLGYIDSSCMVYLCQLLSVSPYGCADTPVAGPVGTCAIGLDIYDANNLLAWSSEGELYFLVNGWHPGNPNAASWEYISAPQFIISTALVSGPTAVLNVPSLGKGIVGYQGTDSVWRSATYPFQCGPGKYGDYASCTVCPAGSYSNVNGATSSSACSSCGAGTYSLAGATMCSICPSGTWSASTGVSVCTDCGGGTYSAATGATSSATCSTCGTGSYSLSGASVCSSCPAGTWSASMGVSACTDCVAGTFSTAVGATSSSVCTCCSGGSFSGSAGQSSCTHCSCGYGCRETPCGGKCTTNENDCLGPGGECCEDPACPP